MNNTLTEKEILKVFSTYLGSEATIQCQKIDAAPFEFLGAKYNDAGKVELIIQGDFSGGIHNVNQKSPVPFSDGCLLRLKRTQSLTNEQAIEAFTCSGYTLTKKSKPLHASLYRSLINEMVDNMFTMPYETYQYLISLGIAVPFYFGKDHWANGKTAVELGLAIVVRY